MKPAKLKAPGPLSTPKLPAANRLSNGIGKDMEETEAAESTRTKIAKSLALKSQY